MIPSMGHQWAINDPSMGIEIFDHKNSFDLTMFKVSTKLWPFKFFIQSIQTLCSDPEDAQIILFGNEVSYT